MKLCQNIIGTTRCHVTTYSTEYEDKQFRNSALNSGAIKDGITSNTSRQLKQASDKRLRTQGAYDTSFHPL